MSQSGRRPAGPWQKITLSFWLGILFLIAAGQDQPATEDCTCTDESAEEDEEGYRLQMSITPTNATLPLGGSQVFNIEVFRVKGTKREKVESPTLVPTSWDSHYVPEPQIGASSVTVSVKNLNQLSDFAKQSYQVPRVFASEKTGAFEIGLGLLILYVRSRKSLESVWLNGNEVPVGVKASEPGTDRKTERRVIITVKDPALDPPKAASGSGESRR